MGFFIYIYLMNEIVYLFIYLKEAAFSYYISDHVHNSDAATNII